MYNGVGLQTARGSGTSGYVQRNLSHVLPGQKPKLQDYGKILQQLKVSTMLNKCKALNLTNICLIL